MSFPGPLFAQQGGDDAALLRVFLTTPLLTLKVVAGIHWEGARLWFKGLRFHPSPEPPKHAVSIGHAPPP